VELSGCGGSQSLTGSKSEVGIDVRRALQRSDPWDASPKSRSEGLEAEPSSGEDIKEAAIFAKEKEALLSGGGEVRGGGL